MKKQATFLIVFLLAVSMVSGYVRPDFDIDKCHKQVETAVDGFGLYPNAWYDLRLNDQRIASFQANSAGMYWGVHVATLPPGYYDTLWVETQHRLTMYKIRPIGYNESWCGYKTSVSNPAPVEGAKKKPPLKHKEKIDPKPKEIQMTR